LEELYLQPAADVLTFDDLAQRFTTTTPAAIVYMLDQSRRITFASRDYGQMGLSCFHHGLVYLEWKSYLDAAARFQEAALFWKLANERPYSCLACFAQGTAQHHALHFEEAMVNYVKAAGEAQRSERTLQGNRKAGYNGDLSSYFAAFNDELGKAQQCLRRDMWEVAGAIGRPTGPDVETAVEAPIINEQLTPADGVPGAALREGQGLYEIVEQRGRFMKVKPGDLLVVEDRRGQTRRYRTEDVVVVSGTTPGSVRVRLRAATGAGEPLYLAKVVGENQSGRPMLQMDESGRVVLPPATLAIWGIVVRFLQPQEVIRKREGS
jgi:hypothetical protein